MRTLGDVDAWVKGSIRGAVSAHSVRREEGWIEVEHIDKLEVGDHLLHLHGDLGDTEQLANFTFRADLTAEQAYRLRELIDEFLERAEFDQNSGEENG